MGDLLGHKRKRKDNRWRKEKRTKKEAKKELKKKVKKVTKKDTKNGAPKSDETKQKEELKSRSGGLLADEGKRLERQKKRQEKQAKKEKALLELKEKRKKFHQKERDVDDMKMREEPSLFLWEKYVAWAGEKLTNVEINTEQWKEDAVVYIENKGNIKPVLKQLKAMRTEISHGRKKKPEQSQDIPGVEVLAVAAAALRAIKMCKSLYTLGKKPAAKLFARHMKLADQAKFLKINNVVPVGGGTPNRVCALLERSLMDFEHVKIFVIDCKRDEKFRSIFDQKETKKDLFTLIHNYGRQNLCEGRVKVVLLGEEEP